MLGSEASRLLKARAWWGFRGSNGEQYGICGLDAELVNVTRRRKYCIYVQGNPILPDRIMIKVKWCLEDANHVERIKTDNGKILDVLYNILSAG